MSIRKQYDTDLEALKAALVEMGSNSAEAVEAALEALCTADAEAAQKIVKGDSCINNMERDIEHRCMTLLLRQQPVAGDLRRISTEDELAARKVIAADDAVDIDFNAIKHTLAQEIAADPAKVDAALDLLMVIKYLERIGDHAVNVAEWVQFVRTGRYKDESMF